MSELKRGLKSGSISIEAGVLDLKGRSVTLEVGDDEYLSSIGVVRIINGGVYNPKGLLLPNVNSLYYCASERIVLPEIVERLNLFYRTEQNIVVSRYIPSIYIHSSDNQLELFDVRCDALEIYNTKFGLYLNRVGISKCSANYYLMKMGVCLN